MQTIANFSDGIPAHLAQSRLEDAGIPSYLADEDTVSFAWHLSNAVGGIKLQVGDEDVERAAAILAEVGDPPTAEETQDPTIIDDHSAADEAEMTLTAREQIADRALRGAIFSIFIFPMQLYVFWLLIKVFVSEEQLRPRHRRNALVAAAINLPMVMVILVGLKSFLMSR